MPNNAPIATTSVLVGGKFANIVGATPGTQVKTGKGVLASVSVNTAGTSSTLVLYDGTSTSGAKIGTFSTTAQGDFTGFNAAFTTGLFVVTTGTNSDITIVYA